MNFRIFMGLNFRIFILQANCNNREAPALQRVLIAVSFLHFF